MTDHEGFEANTFLIQLSHDGADARLVFQGADGERAIIVPQTVLPTILREIQSKIGSGTLVPMSKTNLQPGARFAIQGFQVTPGATWAKTLTLFVDMLDEGRVVSIPIDVTSQQAADLASDLVRGP